MVRRSIALLALIIGIFVIGIGVAIGTISHHVSYQQVGKARILHYLNIPGTLHQTVSIQMENSETLYMLPLSNFTPAIDGKQLFQAGYVYASFAYDKGNTIPIDVTADTGTHLVGDAYRIVAITFSDAAGNQRVFSSGEYVEHPQGYDYNIWPAGFIVMGVGILLTLLGSIPLFVKKRVQPSTSNTYFPGD